MKKVTLRHKSGDKIEMWDCETDNMYLHDPNNHIIRAVRGDVLEHLGYKVLEPREPMKWTGEVQIAKIHIYGDVHFFGIEASDDDLEALLGKRFTARLVENIEGE